MICEPFIINSIAKLDEFWVFFIFSLCHGFNEFLNCLKLFQVIICKISDYFLYLLTSRMCSVTYKYFPCGLVLVAWTLYISTAFRLLDLKVA